MKNEQLKNQIFSMLHTSELVKIKGGLNNSAEEDVNPTFREDANKKSAAPVLTGRFLIGGAAQLAK